MSYFWKTVSGRKRPIIQTHSLWQSRCAFIYYSSVSKERITVLTISRRKVPGMLHLAYIQRDYSARCGPSQLGAVFVQMCVPCINFKVVREVGWVPTPACAYQRAWRTWCDVLSDTTGVVWAWSACRAKRPIPCVSFIALAFSSSALQLDFLVLFCLDSTCRLMIGSELSGPQLVACSVFWE